LYSDALILRALFLWPLSLSTLGINAGPGFANSPQLLTGHAHLQTIINAWAALPESVILAMV